MYPPKHLFRRETISSMLVAACCFVLSSTAAAQAPRHIVIWGENALDWDKALGVDGIRLGCSSAPPGCISSSEKIARSQKASNVFLAIRLNPATTLTYAREYSRLSVGSPILYEVGVDDFVGQSERQKLSPTALSAMLSEIVKALKSENPKLQFGITLYMDELESPEFRLSELSYEFRQAVDVVHLYPHFRKETQTFETALQETRTLFPRSKVIAGLYAYDRRDYLPCARGSRIPCSNQEEIELFRDALQDRWALLRNGDVSAIEFYPGNFGMEEHWAGWEEPRSCSSSRKQECIANTKRMRDIVRKFLEH